MLNNTEILKVAEIVSQEKGIEQDIVMEALEESFEIIGKSKYGMDNNIKAVIDRFTGNITLSHIKDVVETIDPVLQANQILLDHAKKYDENVEIGGQVHIPLPAVNFGRVTANMARQVIYSRVREAEKRRQFNDFKDRVGEILSGIVKRIEFNNIIVDLGKAEGFLRKDELIPRENFKTGDRIRAYFFDIKEESKGHQIFLSRTHPQFMAKLFVQEVPEIYEGQIEILSVARDPGSRGKITVRANDKSIDPVGACVGMRGSRVQAIVNELQGEKIDIVNWSEDPAILVSNALSPAEVQRVNVDAERKKLDVILTEENLSKAIGRRGQNVRLATKLLNYEINIMTDAEDSERRQLEFKEKTENFVKNLELDETLGQLLVAEGFSTIDDIKDSSAENLMKIEGIEEDTAKALIERAKEFHQKDQEDISTRIKELGLEDILINLKGLTPGMLVTLGEQKILTLEDFADLASDELTGGFDVVKGERVKIQGYLEDFALSKEEADELIMSARNIVYKD